MFNNPNYTSQGWVCTDCLMLHANGETDPELSEEETAEYLARVEHYTEGTEVTLGMFRENHECASNFTVVTDDDISHEVRADNENDVRDQFEFRTAPAIVSITPHDLETESDRGGECDCEQVTFSWSPCDMCGSILGGARDAVTFWFGPPETATAS